MAPITAPTNSLQVRASRELGQRVVLGLLLKGLALFQPVLVVGDDVAHAGVGVLAVVAVARL